MDAINSTTDGYPYYYSLAEPIDFELLFTSDVSFSYLRSIEEEKADYSYAPGKWSIKQLIGHISDHERIKMYRAYMLSRKMDIELWGYDQNALVAHSRFNDVSMGRLIDDFYNVRKASASFVSMLSEDQLQLMGNAGPHRISLKNFLRSIVGHEMHHIQVLKEKYS